MATLSYLDNGVLKIGAFSNAGGAIGYLSLSGSANNVVNTYDLGREIQQSYYGTTPDPLGAVTWGGNPWPWNPVQCGDWAGNPGPVLEFTNDGTTIYCRSHPMDWAATNRAITDVVMETWITLEGDIAKVRFRMAYSGAAYQGPARHQEIPAVFVTGTLTLTTYDGASPWTGDALTRRTPLNTNQYGNATESWWAWVNGALDSSWGLGIYVPTAVPGGAGTAAGNPINATFYRVAGVSYVSPLTKQDFYQGDVYDYTCYLTLGTVSEIRSRFAALHAAGAESGPGYVPASPPVDATAPTGTLTVPSSPHASTTVDVTVSGADETELAALPYACTVDDASEPTAWQADGAFTFAGLSEGVHTFRAYVRDAAGNRLDLVEMVEIVLPVEPPAPTEGVQVWYGPDPVDLRHGADVVTLREPGA